ncbi:MAG: dipeptidase [Burkholderiaceae bacterium]
MNQEALALADAQAAAQRIHAEHIVIDSLAPSFVDESALTPAMIEIGRAVQAQGGSRPAIKKALAEHLITHCATDPETRDFYIAYWKRSGVTACNHTLYASGPPDTALEQTMAAAKRAESLMASLQGQLTLATEAAQIEAAHREGRHVIMYNLQNAEPVGADLDRVETLYQLGVRSMQLTYNLRTRFGDGCLETNDGGLSRFGAALIQKMNERRMIVDLSHASANTARDAVACSAQPVLATHTAARALSGHPRGLPDDVLKAIADRGGYAGIVILPAFILPAEGDGRAEKLGKPRSWATLDSVVDHVQHLLNVMGEDHVGIGTDWGKPYYNALTWTPAMVRPEGRVGFNWVGWRPQDRFDPNAQTVGLETWDQWPNLTAAMLHRGIPESTVVKIVGANYLRAMRDICA